MEQMTPEMTAHYRILLTHRLTQDMCENHTFPCGLCPVAQWCDTPGPLKGIRLEKTLEWLGADEWNM